MFTSLHIHLHSVSQYVRALHTSERPNATQTQMPSRLSEKVLGCACVSVILAFALKVWALFVSAFVLAFALATQGVNQAYMFIGCISTQLHTYCDSIIRVNDYNRTDTSNGPIQRTVHRLLCGEQQPLVSFPGILKISPHPNSLGNTWCKEKRICNTLYYTLLQKDLVSLPLSLFSPVTTAVPTSKTTSITIFSSILCCRGKKEEM